MSAPARLFHWQKWLLLYCGTAALGAMLLIGGGLFPPEWFAGWLWWQRLALVLVASPLVVLGCVVCEGVIEAVLYAVVYALREHTLPAVVGLAVLAGLVYAGVGLLKG